MTQILTVVLTLAVAVLIAIGSFAQGNKTGYDKGFEAGKNWTPDTMQMFDSLYDNPNVEATQKFIDDYRSMDSTEKAVIGDMMKIIVKCKEMR